MTDDTILSFGQYKGQKLANISAYYLLYLWDKEKCYGELKDYIEENLDVLREEVWREQLKQQNND